MISSHYTIRIQRQLQKEFEKKTYHRNYGFDDMDHRNIIHNSNI